MSQRDSNGITQRDKPYPFAVHQERDNLYVVGYPVPMQTRRKNLFKSRNGISLANLSPLTLAAAAAARHDRQRRQLDQARAFIAQADVDLARLAAIQQRARDEADQDDRGNGYEGFCLNRTGGASHDP